MSAPNIHPSDARVDWSAEQNCPIADASVKSLGSAIARNQLKFAHQSVVKASDISVAAFDECLARIVDENGKQTNAASFVPDIENHDLGRILDRAALRYATRYIANNPTKRLSINLSANTIGDRFWLQILEQAVQECPACGDLLIVEITENAFLDLQPSALEYLYGIRRLGCSIAIDDFGAGHTSIRHLGKFRFDFLKIDMCFAQQFEQSEHARYLLQSMINIAQHFEMVSVVEGVESFSVAKQLAAMGADCLQGYAIGKPKLLQIAS